VESTFRIVCCRPACTVSVLVASEIEESAPSTWPLPCPLACATAGVIQRMRAATDSAPNVVVRKVRTKRIQKLLSGPPGRGSPPRPGQGNRCLVKCKHLNVFQLKLAGRRPRERQAGCGPRPAAAGS